MTTENGQNSSTTTKENTVAVAIFDFSSASDFLIAVFEQKKKERPMYSVRAWALKLKAGHFTTLSRILSKRRQIPPAMIPAFCKDLDLNEVEAVYFEAMALRQNYLSDKSFDFIRASLRQINSK